MIDSYNFSNYGVPSCKGCKMFFRRSLLAPKTFACKLDGMCSGMNGANRCRPCRFDRCILVGMNPRSMQFPTSVDVAQLSDKVTGPVFEETIADKIIQSLVYVELKVQRIRESSRCVSESVIFRSIRELMESNHENVLAHADQYPKELNWPLSIDEAVRLEESEGRLNWSILDTFLCIEMARTMPVFSQLDYKDQMTMQEFVLLKAVIYSHSAIHGISDRGRVLLEKESSRYSKTLMKHLQSRIGAAPGAKKYAEIVSFVGTLFHIAHQIRQIHIYACCLLYRLNQDLILGLTLPNNRYFTPYMGFSGFS
ncbi:zinc finger, c4 type (two domains) domain-containing protein [Ditylenchus destructor]|uniref:Zinc finger, c4 type (Two domains) domain-containing protein n=1 Tax=Ditylenchus destructor TaxID=166010 RepID=A0AAD4QTD4_9BILA|nr:zinc finger, c4 type (two domains) domain-containing protein [Ditylenchus destructor]